MLKAQQQNLGYIYWVVKCPHCQERRALYTGLGRFPEMLGCPKCEEASAGGAWSVAWCQPFPHGQPGTVAAFLTADLEALAPPKRRRRRKGVVESPPEDGASGDA